LNELAGLRHRVTELEALEAAREQAGLALRASERRFRGIVENSVDGIVLTDERGAIIEWNQAQEQITGVPRNDALGQFVWDVQFRLAPPARKTPDAYERLKALILAFLFTLWLPKA
jgi:PAS domain-containing protein